MRDYLMIEMDRVKLKGFTASNRGKATTVRIELEASDPYALSDMLRSLQELKLQTEAAKPVRPTR